MTMGISTHPALTFMPSNKRILFVAPNLGGGGAERALVNIINHLDRTRFEPHLALFQKEGVFLTSLANDVPLYELQPTDYGVLHRNWTRIRAINTLYQKIRPALIMSVLWQVNSVILMADKLYSFKCPVLINEQNAPVSSRGTDSRRKPTRQFTRWLYQQADHIVVISKGIATELAHEGIASSKITVINNPLDLTTLSENITEERSSLQKRLTLVAVGRLAKQKNYPLLLETVAKLHQRYPLHLWILGEGPEKARLTHLVEVLGLQEVVSFLGFQDNPWSYIKQADIFVLSSDYEGFGNVVIEALAVGTPVIATDCPYGPNEILVGGQYGILVPPGDASAMATAIQSLFDDHAKRKKFQKMGSIRAKDFSVDKIVPQYENLFLELINN